MAFAPGTPITVGPPGTPLAPGAAPGAVPLAPAPAAPLAPAPAPGAPGAAAPRVGVAPAQAPGAVGAAAPGTLPTEAQIRRTLPRAESLGPVSFFTQAAVRNLRERDFALGTKELITLNYDDCILILFYGDNIESQNVMRIWAEAAAQVAGPVFAGVNLIYENKIAESFMRIRQDTNHPFHEMGIQQLPFILVYRGGWPQAFYQGQRTVADFIDYSLTLACTPGYTERKQVSASMQADNRYEMTMWRRYEPVRTTSEQFIGGSNIRGYDPRIPIVIRGSAEEQQQLELLRQRQVADQQALARRQAQEQQAFAQQQALAQQQAAFERQRQQQILAAQQQRLAQQQALLAQQSAAINQQQAAVGGAPPPPGQFGPVPGAIPGTVPGALGPTLVPGGGGAAGPGGIQPAAARLPGGAAAGGIPVAGAPPGPAAPITPPPPPPAPAGGEF